MNHTRITRRNNYLWKLKGGKYMDCVVWPLCLSNAIIRTFVNPAEVGARGSDKISQFDEKVEHAGIIEAEDCLVEGDFGMAFGNTERASPYCEQ